MYLSSYAFPFFGERWVLILLTDCFIFFPNTSRVKLNLFQKSVLLKKCLSSVTITSIKNKRKQINSFSRTK